MVTMWQAFINFWKGYVNFTGRSTRAEFWWMRLWSTIIFFIWLILFVIALVSDSSLISKVDKFSQPNVQGIENWKLMSELLSAPFTFIVVIIGILLALAMFLPNIALTIPRRWYGNLGCLACLDTFIVLTQRAHLQQRLNANYAYDWWHFCVNRLHSVRFAKRYANWHGLHRSSKRSKACF